MYFEVVEGFEWGVVVYGWFWYVVVGCNFSRLGMRYGSVLVGILVLVVDEVFRGNV